MILDLTKNEKQNLEQVQSQLKDYRLWRRVQCLKLKTEGFTHDQVALSLDVKAKTVGKWIKDYQTGGLDQLLQWKCQGRQSQLSSTDFARLRAFHGIQPFLSAQHLQKTIQRTSGVSYHLHWVYQIAHKKLGIQFPRYSNLESHDMVK